MKESFWGFKERETNEERLGFKPLLNADTEKDIKTVIFEKNYLWHFYSLVTASRCCTFCDVGYAKGSHGIMYKICGSQYF